MDAKTLTHDVTRLLRTPAPAGAHAQAHAIADSAARLLGLAPAAAPALSAFERQRAALAQDQAAGLIGKLRRMFGAKS